MLHIQFNEQIQIPSPPKKEKSIQTLTPGLIQNSINEESLKDVNQKQTVKAKLKITK